jgi:hypothetical protein
VSPAPLNSIPNEIAKIVARNILTNFGKWYLRGVIRSK